ncbi:MAG: hypothetical protein C7B45_05245 [Sulfobacillus acidophilus]|uniref:AMP-dependent synthetase/ligase domain-containing protein n=1 Tax=Sulfobacillus acidophilus TaxID=53633 RepID=A0A2T2WKV9_9FIRM|nr:MAG: hypothetical protein C7B45_05245 [Sulfobacillus acidophilus]
MKDGDTVWEGVARDCQWLIDWRYIHHDHRWFVGGYSNVAINVLERHLLVQSNVSAVIDERLGHVYTKTYGELYWASARLARWWHDQGIASGERIAVVGRPTMVGLIAWLAAARLGAVVVRTHESRDLHERLRASEVKWVVVDDQALADRITRTQSKSGPVFFLLCGDEVHKSITSRSWRLADVLENAPGFLDPVAVEANSIGVLLYGDDTQPYAYAGIGGMIGWSASLCYYLGRKSPEAIGVASEFGGLADLLLMTLALLHSGCTVQWLDLSEPLGNQGSPQQIAKLIVDAGHQSLVLSAAPALKRVLVVGPVRPLWRLERLDMVDPVTADMTLGLYRRTDPLSLAEWRDNPARDRSHAQHPQAEADFSHGQLLDFKTWPAMLQELEGVADVARTVDAEGKGILWVRMEGDTAFVPQQIALRQTLASVSTDRVVCIREFPETEEGRVAFSTLSSVGRGETRISLSGLRNPDVVETLVRAWVAVPTPGVSASGWLA